MREQWEHTAQLVSMIHNVNCSKKADQKNADHFNPMIKKRKKSGNSVGFAAFKAFMKPRLPNHNKHGLIKDKDK